MARSQTARDLTSKWVSGREATVPACSVLQVAQAARCGAGRRSLKGEASDEKEKPNASLPSTASTFAGIKRLSRLILNGPVHTIYNHDLNRASLRFQLE